MHDLLLELTLYMKIHRTKVLLLGIIGLLVILVVIITIEPDQYDSDQELVFSKAEEDVITDTLAVDVKGAVLNPGVYELALGTRVIDAVLIAGGLLDSADTIVTNLSKLLTDGMVIVIYTKEEVATLSSLEFSSITAICDCPKLENDSCFSSSLISINTASLEELMTLPGVGESKAKSIIAYREEHGLFTTIEEIQTVSGIGVSLFEQIRTLITI